MIKIFITFVMLIINNSFNACDSSQTFQFSLGRRTGASPELFVARNYGERDLPLITSMLTINNSNARTNKSNPVVGYSSPNEHDAVLLNEMCEHISDLNSYRLLAMHDTISDAFEHAIEANPHLASKYMKAFAYINYSMLCNVLDSDIAARIQQQLKPVIDKY